MTLLQQMDRREKRQREELRHAVKVELRAALRELIPDCKVIVFGSLAKPGCFSDVSDIDLAIEAEPARMTVYRLTSLLAEQLGRRVDVVLLPECRFRERILREGEVWTPPG